MSLTQTQKFPFKSLFIERQYSSVTQSSYSVVTPDGKVVVSGFSAEAPYNNEALCHVKYDGRKDVWAKTDQELTEDVAAFIGTVDICINGKLVEKLLKAIQQHTKN